MAQHIVGAVTLGDGMVLIHDVAAFLSSSESESLEAALATQHTVAWGWLSRDHDTPIIGPLA